MRRGSRARRCSCRSTTAGARPVDLRLAVAAADNADAPRGVLVDLTGGPGSPASPFVPRSRARMRALLHDYRLVMFDQRGTGARALRCPRAAARDGHARTSRCPPPGTVERVRAPRSGPNRALLLDRRHGRRPRGPARALGADKLALDGVSYGTYVAERYALAHPRPRGPAGAGLGRAARRPRRARGRRRCARRRASCGPCAARRTAPATRRPTSQRSCASATTGPSCSTR